MYMKMKSIYPTQADVHIASKSEMLKTYVSLPTTKSIQTAVPV
jgi:hypothetical protein